MAHISVRVCALVHDGILPSILARHRSHQCLPRTADILPHLHLDAAATRQRHAVRPDYSGRVAHHGAVKGWRYMTMNEHRTYWKTEELKYPSINMFQMFCLQTVFPSRFTTFHISHNNNNFIRCNKNIKCSCHMAVTSGGPEAPVTVEASGVCVNGVAEVQI